MLMNTFSLADLYGGNFGATILLFCVYCMRDSVV
jgi:hypothetical protein